MKEALSAIYLELLRRQECGEHSILLSDDTLAYLREEAGKRHERRRDLASERPLEDERASTEQAKKAIKAAVPPAPEIRLSASTAAERLEELRARLMADSWCRSQVREGKQVVFGTGSIDADIFFCGEAPGAEEEEEGEPFVGPAGQLLTRVIHAMGLQRSDVYIANIMTYRPPLPGMVGNRAPTEAEMAYCLPYLLGQLEIVNPKVVVALGRTAVDGLLGPDRKRKMTQFRGTWQSFSDRALMPTFHPSYLLRNDKLEIKRQLWEDMLAVMERVGMSATDKQRGYFLK